MRVAIVCPYAWDLFGGVQSHVRALARALRRRGHEVTVLAPSLRPTGSAPEEDGVRLVGRSVRVPANGSVAPLAFGAGAAVAVKRVVGEIEPDVMHLHEPLIPSLSLLAVRGSRVPMVGTFHASAGSSVAYQVAKPGLTRAWKKLDVKTAVSDAARDLISRYFPGEYPLTPNGVEVARFSEADAAITPTKKVLFLGRIERRKGLEVLIQAMARLDDTGAELVVAGTGPRERACEALAERLRVPASFIGRVEEADLASLFRGASVYCAPGLGGESFGIVLIEAMAAEAPVVCSDLPGYRAVAEPAAVLVPPGDAGALAVAIRRVLEEGSLASELRTRGAARARDFDWDRLSGEVETLYRKAMG